MIATTGRPGPVLIDMPKDVQLDQCVPDYDAPMNLPGYHVRRSPRPGPNRSTQVAAAIKRAKRPVIYAGGGIIIGRRQRRAARAGRARPAFRSP